MTQLKKTFVLAALLLLIAPKFVKAQLNFGSTVSALGASMTLMSPSGLCATTYDLDVFRSGVSSGNTHIYIGGSAPNLPIMWNAYPSNTSSGGAYYEPKFENSNSVAGHAMQQIYEQWTGRMSFQYSTQSTWNAGDVVTWATVLNFDANGDVGIGTPSNTCYMLTVNGNIGCKALKVITPQAGAIMYIKRITN